MKTRNELKEIAAFIAEYATLLIGSGVHTSRVVRNCKRIGQSQNVDVRINSSQRTIVMTIHDNDSDEVYTEVADIPPCPISFELNSELSTLSWSAVDNHLPLETIKERFEKIKAKPKIDQIYVLCLVGLANASFCRLFGGDIGAMSVVFTSTLIGYFAKQQMLHHHVNHFITFTASALIASLSASISLAFNATAEIAIATSVLFLIPGVPLINSVIDITEGHILTGCSRLIHALLLVLCIAIGLSLTLFIVKDSLL